MIEVLNSGSHMGVRRFLGSRDIQYVALHLLFPSSNVVVVSSVEIEDRWPLVIEGPEHHINFLKPLFSKMIKESPVPGDVGSWVGLQHERAERLNLFYEYGKDIKDRIELLQSKLRYDLVKHTDLRLSEISVLEVVYDDEQILQERVALPDDFKNGTVTLPVLWLN